MSRTAAWSGRNRLTDAVTRARFEARSIAGQYRPYVPYLRRKRSIAGLDGNSWWDMGVVDAKTDIVIDGFFRTGNTFALAAFLLANGNKFRVGHHAVNAAQVKIATDLGIPTVVIAREPEPTILSCAMWSPVLSLRQWLRLYTRYYASVVAVRRGLMVATFEEVTTAFDMVIEGVNRSYGSRFEALDQTDENVAAVFRLLEENDMRRFSRVNESQVSRPSAQREVEKLRLREQFSALPPEHLRRAELVYDSLLRRRGEA